MLQVHLGDGLGDARRFAEVEFGRTSRLNGAKAAGAGANIAQNHHGCRPARPAFTHIRALCAFADRVQVMVIHDAADFFVFGAGRQLGSQPIRFPLCRHWRYHWQKVRSVQLLKQLSRTRIRPAAPALPSSR